MPNETEQEGAVWEHANGGYAKIAKVNMMENV
jgi:hypothetical protein